MQVGQQGRIGFIAPDAEDLTYGAGLAKVRTALVELLNRREIAGLALILPPAAASERHSPILTEICIRLVAVESPVVAALQGEVRGAVLALAMAARYRLLSPDVNLYSAETDQGRLPRAGVLARLSTEVAPKIAWDMVVGGRRFSADAAVALGLGDGVISGDPTTAAVTLCRKLSARRAGPRAIRAAPLLLPPSAQTAQAGATRAALDIARTQPFPQAARAIDALDDRLAQGREARRLAQLTAAEKACRRAAPPLSPIWVPGPVCRLTRSLASVGALGRPGSTLTIHLNPDRGEGVLEASHGARVPIALAGPGMAITLVEIGQGAPQAQALAEGLALRIGALPLLGGLGLTAALRDAALDAADRAVAEGASMVEVDAAMIEAGWEAGPYGMSDRAGHGARLSRRAARAGNRDPRETFIPLIEVLQAARPTTAHLRWAMLDTGEMSSLLDRVRADCGARLAPAAPTEIARRIETAVTLASLRLTDRATEAAITLAAIHGLGMPRHACGPIWGQDLSEVEALRAHYAVQDPIHWARPDALAARLPERTAV